MKICILDGHLCLIKSKYWEDIDSQINTLCGSCTDEGLYEMDKLIYRAKKNALFKLNLRGLIFELNSTNRIDSDPKETVKEYLNELPF